MHSNEGNTMLKPKAAAKYVGLTEGWLAKLRMTGGGPLYAKFGRRVMYRRDDLDTWIAAHMTTSTTNPTRAKREGWA